MFKNLLLLIAILGPIVAMGSVSSRFSITIIPPAECYDGIDNDLDGLIDYPNDSDCSGYTDNTEGAVITPPPPPPSGGGGGGQLFNNPTTQPETVLHLSGYAYPNSRVLILKDEEVIIETTTAQDARFNVTFREASSGSFTITTYAVDSEGRRSKLFSFPITITSGATIDITGIVLAPTVDSDKVEVRRGDPIRFFGTTVPNSQVVLEVNSETQYFLNTSSNDDGFYSYSFNSALLEPGNHTSRPSVYLSDGNMAGPGGAVSFLVGTQNRDRVYGSEAKCALIGDFNNDNRVNIIDFSIASFWYQKKITKQSVLEVERVCLNNDGFINLTDLSIMAYWWTG